MSGLQYFLDRLRNLIPPSPPTSGLALQRLAAYAEFLGAQSAVGGMTTQDMQAQNMEGAMALGATIQHPGTTTQAVIGAFPAAAGISLDRYGQVYGVPRQSYEDDSTYARRILAVLVQPSITLPILGKILDSFFSVTGTVVTDVTQASFNQFNNGVQANCGVRCVGFDAPFNTSGGGLSVAFPPGTLGRASGMLRFNTGLQTNDGIQANVPGVGASGLADFPYPAIGSGPLIALVESALVNQKAAGTRVAIVTG